MHLLFCLLRSSVINLANLIRINKLRKLPPPKHIRKSRNEVSIQLSFLKERLQHVLFCKLTPWDGESWGERIKTQKCKMFNNQRKNWARGLPGDGLVFRAETDGFLLGSERWGIARGVIGNGELTTLTRVSMFQWWMNHSSRRYPSENMPI